MMNNRKENELSRVSTSDDNKVPSIVIKRRQLLEDDMGDSTHMMTKPLLQFKDHDSYIFILSSSTRSTSVSITSQNANSSTTNVGGQQVTEKTTLETTARIACVSADQVAPSVANTTKRLLARPLLCSSSPIILNISASADWGPPNLIVFVS